MTACGDELAAWWPGDPPGPPAAMAGRDPTAVMRCVYDFEGYALAASPACSSVLGWSPEELASAPYWELLHPGDQHPTVERAQQMLFSGPRRVDLEVRMLRRDGTNRRISWSCRSSVRLERVYSVGVDVTDRASVEACDRVLVGSWDWHIGSDIVAWSDGMFEIYGIRRGPAHSPATALRRLHTEDRPVVDRIIRRSVETGEPYSADHRIVLSDGDVRWLHSAGRVISGAGGSPERMRGITLDITARPGMRMVG